ncbi:MAG: ABC transporter substrate-binding protein [bacterium]|nr:ABC transporter substrate-binding protein [bacterium]
MTPAIRVILMLVTIGHLAMSVSVAAGSYTGKKILHIDSYHRGNTWNDGIADAVGETLRDTGVEFKVIHLDTKRNKSKEFKEAAALKAKAIIEEFQPDLVTASDDNASKYLIMPYYKDAELPFVFCGVNWDASVYGFPYKNVTGMVEVSPIPQIIRLLKQYAKGGRIGYLAEDTHTKRKELEYHSKLFDIEYDSIYLVKSFEEWRRSFLKAQEEVDMLMLMGVAALTDWNHEEAKVLAEQNSKIPVGTDFGWLMHYALIGVGKLPDEQGRWVASAALKILDNVSPSEIPLAYNKEGKLYFNPRIGARLGIDKTLPMATTEFPAPPLKLVQ